MNVWYVWAAWPFLFLVIGVVYLLIRLPGSNEEPDWFSPGAGEEFPRISGCIDTTCLAYRPSPDEGQPPRRRAQTSHRLHWLDALRGLAALVVAMYHLNGALGLPRIEFGFLAVPIFFVLSGIVLGRRYEAAIREGMRISEFAWARLRRLYPMVLITCLLMLVAMVAGLEDRAYAMFTAATLFSTLTLTPCPAALGTGTAFPADPALWSLSAELIANAAWFGLVKLGRRVAFVGGTVAMAMFLAFAVAHGNFDLGARSGIREHLAGWASALGWFTVGYAISLSRPRPRAPIWLLLALFVGSCAVYHIGWVRGVAADLFVVVSATVLMLGLMNAEPRSAVVARVCTWLGMMSYPLYMVHLPASRLAEWAVSFGAPTACAHAVVVLGVAALATLVNEAVVMRLPTKVEWRNTPGSSP